MPAKNGRNVALTDEQNALVERLVKSGRYASASEVVRDGLRLLQRDEEARLLDKWLIEGLTAEEEASIPPDVLNRARETIRAKIREGLDEARRGNLVDGEEFFARWKTRLEDAASLQRGKTRALRRRA
ncbi:MAG: type II toxin-antitoxin system ParD family antitoxin [Phycisphaerae bacterium]|nr:type II toxin-antitoxin system ParD family antitoxin [Phycisphaerae bacterium]